MKRLLKWTGVVLGVVVVALLGAVGFVQATWSVDHPDTPLPAVRASDDPDVIVRGEYLVHAVAHCSTCHAAFDGSGGELDFDAPLIGGFVFEVGPFGTYTAANLTPHATGIGGKSDGQVARAIRHGIGSDGRLAPMMRFGVGPMSDDDVAAIISYLRAQPPVEAERAGPAYGFLAKTLSRRFRPRLDSPPAHVPEGGISLERGRYLAEGPAFCAGCHTPADPMQGFAPSGPALSGGNPEPDPANPGYEIVAPNLTPDPRTGHIVGWSEDQFVARFAAGRIIDGSIMPWQAYGRMTEADVRSIYRFLMSLDPVENDVGPTYRPKGRPRG